MEPAASRGARKAAGRRGRARAAAWRPARATALLLAAGTPPVAGNHWRSLFKGSHVIEFEPATFNETVLSDSRMWVVVYYAHWCGHCQHYAPSFQRMAAGLLQEQARVRLGALDCAVWNDFCHKLDVHSYPTVRAYHVVEPRDRVLMPASQTRNGAEVPRDVYHSEDKLPKWVLARLPAPAAARAAAGAAAPHAAAPTSAGSAGAAAHASEAPTAAPTAAAAAAGASKSPGAVASTTVASAAAAAAAAATPTAAPRRAPPPTPPPAAAQPAPQAPAPLPAPASPETAALRLVDAEVALLYSLRQGAFLAASSSGGGPPVLQGEALVELRAWLELLATTLPNRQACDDVRALVGVVAKAQGSASGALEEGAWVAALDSQGVDGIPPQAGREPEPYWRLCRTYTCGLWTLFHIVTIAVAEGAPARGFLASAGGLPEPEEVLAGVRGFVARFLGCQECASHFVQTFDSCSLGRCQLDSRDGEGASLWLWRVHNGVTRRVRAEGGATAQAFQPWPPREECAACWAANGSEEQWDPKAVYEHLKATFWQPGWAPGGRAAAGPDPALAAGLLALAALGYFVWRAVSSGDGLRSREKGN